MAVASHPNLIVICGPTACGKTQLAVAVARYCRGEILSVDSRQVYRGLNIGTGKDLEEYEKGGPRVRTHLLDIVDPAMIYTLWHFQRAFYQSFSQIRARNCVPIAVGGSGLYLEAVLRHYAIPNVPENTELRKSLMQQDKSDLDSRLHDLDPQQWRRTDRTSKKRLVRALEVSMSGALPEAFAPPLPEIRPLVFYLSYPRPLLYERIRIRLCERFDGIIAETKVLLAEGISPERLRMFGLEYRHAADFCLGRTDKNEMFENLYTAIRHFAKRQETYFRGMERRGLALQHIHGLEREAVRRIVDRYEKGEGDENTPPSLLRKQSSSSDPVTAAG